jgi:twitching motility protein PilT
MKILKIENELLDTAVSAMGKSELFGSLTKKSLIKIAENTVMNQYAKNELIVKENDSSDSFFMMIEGEAGVYQHHAPSDQEIELCRITPFHVTGEMGLILKKTRTATVKALKKTIVLKFDETIFKYMFQHVPTFGLSLTRDLANRLATMSKRISLPEHDMSEPVPAPEVLKMLPMPFMIRFHVLPLAASGNTLRVGFVHDPSAHVLSAIRRIFPSFELKPVHIDMEFFNKVLQTQAGVEGFYPKPEPPEKGKKVKKAKKIVKQISVPKTKLEPLLQRMMAEGASDLHLSAGITPRWRIDGEMHEITDSREFGQNEVYELLKPIMAARNQKEFDENNDTDFIYPLADGERFRTNLFRDENGIGAVLRLVPSKILTFEQLGLPVVLKRLCDYPKGLVLVTGPTGSGKSTTLAAMIDYINDTRSSHIITMEDPIEFVHGSKKCLINQREVGRHTKSFANALRAGLREDPDIVLVGELRDLETISLALETANTGHLVFATLHTATAITTIDRVIDAYPPDQQAQIRTSLRETLKGVVSQTLCKRIGGGRVAALELLIVNLAVANLIREDKLNQIASMMQTGKALGNRLLNEELAKLVKQQKVDFKEALSKTMDKPDLANRLNRALPKEFDYA